MLKRPPICIAQASQCSQRPSLFDILPDMVAGKIQCKRGLGRIYDGWVVGQLAAQRQTSR